jgi:hypothetical protein
VANSITGPQGFVDNLDRRLHQKRARHRVVVEQEVHRPELLAERHGDAPVVGVDVAQKARA